MDNWKIEEEDECEVVEDFNKVDYNKLSSDQKAKIENRFQKGRSFLYNFGIALIMAAITLEFCFMDDFKDVSNWWHAFMFSVIAVLAFHIFVLSCYVTIAIIKESKLSIKGKMIFVDVRDMLLFLFIPLDSVFYGFFFKNKLAIICGSIVAIVLFIFLTILCVVASKRGASFIEKNL